MKKLSCGEKILCIFTILLYIAAMVMAICVFLVTPQSTDAKSMLQQRENCHCSQITKRKQRHGLTLMGLSDNSQKVRPDRNKNLKYCVPPPRSSPVAYALKTTKIEDFPYIVSINTLRFNDDMDDKKYLCTGTIISNIWVLTASDCLQEIKNLEAIVIRSGSPMWSEGGSVHRITKKSDPFRGAIAIKIQPYLRFSRFVRKVEALLTNKKYNFDSALSVLWKNKYMYPVENDTFSIEKWSTYACVASNCNTGEIDSNTECKGRATGAPLIPECQILAAIHVGSICGESKREKFVNMQSQDMQNWLYKILEADESRRLLLQDTETSNVIFSQYTDDYFLESCSVEYLNQDNPQKLELPEKIIVRPINKMQDSGRLKKIRREDLDGNKDIKNDSDIIRHIIS